MRTFCIHLFVVIMVWFPMNGYSQQKEIHLRFVFYNAENFFDPEPDTTRNYNEFTPQGARHWTPWRYHLKIQHLYKTLIAVGQGNAPALVGFAEVENRQVLSELIQQTPLFPFHYQIIHFDSPDVRGIDVGCIYRPELLKILHSQAIKVRMPHEPQFRTRDILYLKILIKADTLHLFINHWPSRYGGLMETIDKRKQAAKVLMHFVDSIGRQQPNAYILVMGDFNENPDDQAIQILTQCADSTHLTPLKPLVLYGLAKGSIKKAAQWTLFDQAFVSKSLVKKSGKLMVNDKSFYIFDAAFLLEKDGKNMGLKPNRTFIGFKYHGGFSDHLPVFVDLISNKNQQP